MAKRKARSKRAETPEERLRAARECDQLLRRALKLSITAGAPRTATRIRLAITSVGGAVRNADNRAMNEGLADYEGLDNWADREMGDERHLYR